MKRQERRYTDGRRHHRPVPRWFWLAIAILGLSAYWFGRSGTPYKLTLPLAPEPKVVVPRSGDLLGVDSIQTFTPAQAGAMARENYRAATLPVTTAITKITFHYRMDLPEGGNTVVYGRAYLPAAPQSNLPIFAFASGTTGVGDKCAPSLEQPHISDWANYDSHMTMYASQGYAAVITDYEGMRDPNRIHHYMVGELEGRAVLDSIRALKNLPETANRLNPDLVFLGGYSQGGHAAFWADKIAAKYAPEIKPKGVVGYGPVMSVKQTLADITGTSPPANINWFGPYVLYSYQDYYKTNYGSILLPRWEQSLATDVPAHCIDTVLHYWKAPPTNIYQPDFLQLLASNTLSEQYLAFERDMERNAVGSVSTSSAKRINQGQYDDVVLASQQNLAMPALCQSSTGPVQLVVYPGANHYNTMVRSLNDTLAWMRVLANGGTVPRTCN